VIGQTVQVIFCTLSVIVRDTARAEPDVTANAKKNKRILVFIGFSSIEQWDEPWERQQAQ
jgi:hypothetical protein